MTEPNSPEENPPPHEKPVKLKFDEWKEALRGSFGDRIRT